MTVQEHIATILRDDPALAALATGLVWTRPLYREGMDNAGEFAGDLAPTPEAFDEETAWVKPCVVISPRLDRGPFYGASARGSKHMMYAPLLAYYAPPDDQQGAVLNALSLAAGGALAGASVEYAPGKYGRVVIPHEVAGSVPIPEMPHSGVVMTERIEVVAVFDRA